MTSGSAVRCQDQASDLAHGAAGKPTEALWPQAHTYNTDIAKAKALLTEAGYPDGFETTLSFDLGFAGVNEPLCVLVQESLGQIGDKTTYDTDVKGFIDLAFTDMPRIPLYQPYVNVAMQKNVSGYEYWFHRRLDYRAMVKA